MKEEKRSSPPGFPMSETIAILIMTCLSYWFVFRYESAYLSEFGVPIELLDITITALLSAALYVSGFAFAISFITSHIVDVWPKNPAAGRKLMRIVIILMLPIWRTVNFGLKFNDWPYYAFPALAIVIFEIAVPLYFRIKDLTFVEDKTDEEKVFFHLRRVLGPYFYFALAALIGTIFSGALGSEKANGQIYFPVSKKDSTVVLIRAYPERYLCIRIDYKDKSIQSFLIQDSEKDEYVNKEIGLIRLPKW
jgi:hypothetical protein